MPGKNRRVNGPVIFPDINDREQSIINPAKLVTPRVFTLTLIYPW
jgi:hypothetical protein